MICVIVALIMQRIVAETCGKELQIVAWDK